MANKYLRKLNPILAKPGPSEKEIVVKFNNVEYVGEKAIVKEKSLVESLIKNKDHTLRVLSLYLTPLKAEDITLDDDCRVVISNYDFSQALKDRGTVLPSVNTWCTNYSCS